MSTVDWGQLRRALRRKCHDEDAVQEALLRVLTRGELPANPLGYALRVAWLETRGSKHTRYASRHVLVDDRLHADSHLFGSRDAEQDRRLEAREELERLVRMGVRNLDAFEMEG